MGKKAISNRWIVVECLLIVLLFTLCMHENIVGFAYDSGVYWALAQSFWETGSFDFLSYPVSIRGYALPLFLGILLRIGVALFENPICGVSFILHDDYCTLNHSIHSYHNGGGRT